MNRKPKKLSLSKDKIGAFARRVGAISDALRSVADREEHIFVAKSAQRPEKSEYTSCWYIEIAVERQTGWSSTIFLVPSIDKKSGATGYWYAFSVMLSANDREQRNDCAMLFKDLMSKLHRRKPLKQIEVRPGHRDVTSDIAIRRGEPVQELAYNRSRESWFERHESVYLPFDTPKDKLLMAAEKFYARRWRMISDRVEKLTTGRGTRAAREAFVRRSRRGRKVIAGKHASLQDSFRDWYARHNEHGYQLSDIKLDRTVKRKRSADAVVYRRNKAVAVVEVKPTRGEFRTAIGQLFEYATALQSRGDVPISRFIAAFGERLQRTELTTIDNLRRISQGKVQWEFYGLDAEGEWQPEAL